MVLLEQLMEIKDLEIYIDLRIKHLLITEKDITKFPEYQRESIKERMKGRIKELQQLKKLISTRKLKEADKRYWQEAAEENVKET